MKNITVDELKKCLSSSLLVDIRSAEAYGHGYIDNAVSFPEPVNIEELVCFIEKIKPEKVVVYCTRGLKSEEVVNILTQYDINAYNLGGGYDEWLIKHYEDPYCEENLYYSRQMVLPELGIAGQNKLRNSKVMIIGAGALGTSALMYLAAAGVGTIGIVEGDTVDITNLHRQILYSIEDVGSKKVEAAKRRLESGNPYINIISYDTFATPDNISELIKDYDFVIDATDRIETKFLINDACVIKKIPFCHAGILGFYGQVMSWCPGDNPCYRCIFEDIPEDYIPNCAESGIIGAVSGIIGSVQALEAIKYITKIGSMLVGRMLRFDGLTMNTRVIKLPKKNDNCKVCGNKATISDVKNNKDNYKVKQRCSI
ncbi:MAG: ThiF family adenylyltransferase [Lachnospiraceae bacterium]|nr:ThiF family adenylyltransferase [Lachnospiraceae bacterium]